MHVIKKTDYINYFFALDHIPLKKNTKLTKQINLYTEKRRKRILLKVINGCKREHQKHMENTECN